MHPGQPGHTDRAMTSGELSELASFMLIERKWEGASHEEPLLLKMILVDQDFDEKQNARPNCKFWSEMGRYQIEYKEQPYLAAEKGGEEQCDDQIVKPEK